jgi:hypothetical protein
MGSRLQGAPGRCCRNGCSGADCGCGCTGYSSCRGCRGYQGDGRCKEPSTGCLLQTLCLCVLDDNGAANAAADTACDNEDNNSNDKAESYGSKATDQALLSPFMIL